MTAAGTTAGTGRGDHLSLDVLVRAPAEAVFAALIDWEGQGDWMLGTRVRVSRGDGVSVGSELTAVTGLGSKGVVDTMEITRFDPGERVDVLHTGRIVRGTGTMEVLALPGGLGRFVWSEQLDIPLGRVGRWGWPLVRPAFRWGVERSLTSFARLVESGRLPRDPLQRPGV